MTLQAEQLVLPIIATAALGTALIVPLRERRNSRPIDERVDLGVLRTDVQGRDAAPGVSARGVSALASQLVWFGNVTKAIIDFYSLAPSIHAPASPERDADDSFDADLPHFDSGSSNGGVPTFESGIPFADVDYQILHSEVAIANAEPSIPDDASSRPISERSFASESDELRPVAQSAKAFESKAGDTTLDPGPGHATIVPGAGDTTIVPRARRQYERAVPLTRAPLRSAHPSLTWPAMVDARATSLSRAERHGWLKAANDDAASEAALLAAYREEDTDGRLLALQSLVRCRFAGARDCLVDALRLGSDEERAFAVDGLVALGDRASLGMALADRVDAIAARAALGFVASEHRSDYTRALEPFVDSRRIESILGLLAGVLR